MPSKLVKADCSRIFAHKNLRRRQCHVQCTSHTASYSSIRNDLNKLHIKPYFFGLTRDIQPFIFESLPGAMEFKARFSTKHCLYEQTQFQFGFAITINVGIHCNDLIYISLVTPADNTYSARRESRSHFGNSRVDPCDITDIKRLNYEKIVS